MDQRYGYGWKARVGCLMPQSVTESGTYELQKLMPEGVIVNTACCGIRDLVPEELDSARNRMVELARELARRKADIILQSGIPPLLARGKRADQEIIQAIQKATGLPATTDVTSAMEAFRQLGVKRICTATPWGAKLDQELKGFLEDYGFQVLSMQTMEAPLIEMPFLPIETSYLLARRAFLEAPEAQAIYIPCGAWAAIPHIDRMERELRVPVVTAMQAMAWATLTTLGIGEPIPGYGRLLAL